MYSNLRLIYGQSEEAEQWRERQREAWAEAAEQERQELEHARRMDEQRQHEHQQEQDMYELDCAIYAYLMDDITEATAEDVMYRLGFNPSDLERLALEMIDHLEAKP